MIYERDIDVGDRRVHVKLLRPTKERFKTLPPDTVAWYYCLYAEAECEGVKAPLHSVSIPRSRVANAPEVLQEKMDQAMQKAAERCALLVGAHENIMELPEG